MGDTTTAISQAYVSSYGSSVGDINNDGYPDILVMNDNTDNLNIWQNNGGSNNWIKFTLEGVLSNRNAIGSWVELYDEGTVQYRYSRCGTKFRMSGWHGHYVRFSQSPMVDSVIVRWPGGLINILQPPSRQFLSFYRTCDYHLNGSICVRADAHLP